LNSKFAYNDSISDAKLLVSLEDNIDDLMPAGMALTMHRLGKDLTAAA